MKNSYKIYIITDSFPFDGAKEETFLITEISLLLKSFEHITLVPIRKKGNIIEISDVITVDESLSKIRSSIIGYVSLFINALIFPYFWKELIAWPGIVFKLNALQRLIYYSGVNNKTSKWFKRLIRKNKIDFEKTIFYTYWYGISTLGISIHKQKYPKLKVITRAHGYDLYNYRYNPPYIPFQKACLQNLKKVFFISNNGKKYFLSKYPNFSHIFETERLGVMPPKGLNCHFDKCIYRIVSCSYLTPVKRIDLLVRALIIMAKNKSEEKFEWVHFGGGPLLESLQKLFIDRPHNLLIKLITNYNSSKITNYYMENSIDIFINVSSSEGISVAIMEAISYGLPILATNVGGSSEIVNENNGRLVEKDISPNDLAQAIWNGLNDSKNKSSKRIASFNQWKNNYDANKNFSSFSEKLISLLNESL